jgi:hypothetical protein
MRRYDPTDLTPRISLSVDESWYENYWFADHRETALARLWHKLRVALADHAAIRARPWPGRTLKASTPLRATAADTRGAPLR